MKFLSLLFLFSISLCSASAERYRPNVLVTTDINNAGGDPDDKQSLLHLLWYSDMLNIVGIVPEAWNHNGYQATMDDIGRYRMDYKKYNFGNKGLAHPDSLAKAVTQSEAQSVDRIINAALSSTTPLYILVWGNMLTLQKALDKNPAIVEKIRVLTIATGVKYGPADEVLGKDCKAVNWNGRGRNEIFADERFDRLWWIENNWTYNGMFGGPEPKKMLDKLGKYGVMGAYLREIVENFDWARYFRAGDTPTVLYLIDPKNNLDQPQKGSWAGRFAKPFPDKKANFYTDDAGKIEWNYANPCETWVNAKPLYEFNKATLTSRRNEMYDALLTRLKWLYAL